MAEERDLLEERRIEARRMRDIERMQRFKMMRSAGVDVVTLGAQVEDAACRKKEAEETDKRYACMQAEVGVEMERLRLEEEERRERSARALRREWDKQRLLPKNNAPLRGAPIDVEKCGLAATQTLSDDISASVKVRKARQMRNWAAEATATKLIKEQKELEEERRFAEWEKKVYEERLKAESFEKVQIRQQKKDLMQEYSTASALKAQNTFEEKRRSREADALEIEKNLTDPMLCEELSSYDKEGRLRIDHFRGYSKGQTKAIYMENENLKKEKAQDRQNQKIYDDAFNEHLKEFDAYQIAEEDHRATTRQNHLLAVKADHEAQRKLDNDKKIQTRKDSFGTIAPQGGLMYGFGQSYR